MYFLVEMRLRAFSFAYRDIPVKTFRLPKEVTGADKTLGEELVNTWRREGIFYIQMEDEELELATKAMEAHKEFVKQPLEEKKECVSKLTYSG
jgi:isopenicillin N synthase-like dioxygenase